MIAFVVTLVLWLFAGCPDAEKGVAHPDLDAVMAELETPVAGAVKDAGKALPKAQPKRERRARRRPFGGGEL